MIPRETTYMWVIIPCPLGHFHPLRVELLEDYEDGKLAIRVPDPSGDETQIVPARKVFKTKQEAEHQGEFMEKLANREIGPGNVPEKYAEAYQDMSRFIEESRGTNHYEAVRAALAEYFKEHPEASLFDAMGYVQRVLQEKGEDING